ncbi:conserved hypothetical protein [Desulfosarcina cetonica]|uniref:SRPBCC domain-containing protein n=1 Tax=Desulfosarcina cetonica TaxID=90730 RepID=UPI0006D11032|nr:SRPBCC domain-containing protein [Desulfosarcina cetonica]VTR70560.1 conserved hypothetical protein [Desulfosarcina cetonica]
MREIKTEIMINAKPDKIWSVLIDFERYPDWNPFIKSISGNKEVGGHLAVEVQPPERNPLILRFESGRELRWKGKFIIKGIFDGEHYFLINGNDDGTATLIQGEKFSGLLVSLLGKVLENTKRGFILMNEALKKKMRHSVISHKPLADWR